VERPMLRMRERMATTAKYETVSIAA